MKLNSSFLLRKGLLNLGDTNYQKQFFKNLIKASRTDQGRKIIEHYANSDSDIPPDLSKLRSTDMMQDVEQEIQSASSEDKHYSQ